MPACSSGCPTSRPPAAPSSNGWRARSCPASPSCARGRRREQPGRHLVPAIPRGSGRADAFTRCHRVLGNTVSEGEIATAVVVVHHLEQARAALRATAEAGCAIELQSAPGAAGYAGVGYLKALGDQAGRELWIDCDDDA